MRKRMAPCITNSMRSQWSLDRVIMVWGVRRILGPDVMVEHPVQVTGERGAWAEGRLWGVAEIPREDGVAGVRCCGTGHERRAAVVM